MKSLKISVIIAVFGYIFLLTIETADLSVYHDLGPSHIDANSMAIVHAHHNKDLLLFNAIMLLFPASPKLLARVYPYFPEDTYLNKLTLLTQSLSRAPPV